MGKLKQKFINFAAKLYFRFAGSPLSQAANTTALGGEVAESTAELMRRAAAEGAVLLKNDGALPLSGKIALFGRCQNDTFFSGYGSGGNVLTPYRVSIAEGIAESELSLVETLSKAYRDFSEKNRVAYGGWGEWPRSLPEMPLTEELMNAAREETDIAVVVLGRAAGEDRDHELREGSYYLSEGEKKMLALVTVRFERTVVLLNFGSIIDLSWIEDYPLNAVLLVWQGGMEAGRAVADLLTGRVSPCGKLPDTVARAYEDHPSAKSFGNAAFNFYTEDIYVGYRYFETFAPERVLFPFGFGLSYTTFDVGATFDEKTRTVRYRVRNTGESSGREVVQVYIKKPSGELGNPARELVGFQKTKLLPPGSEEEGEIALPERAFCSFDESRAAYVRLAGEYEIFVGADVRAADAVCSFTVESDCIVEQMSIQCAPRENFLVLGSDGKMLVHASNKKDLRAEILSSLPPVIPYTGDRGYLLSDVVTGKVTMEEFVAQLTHYELEDLAFGALKMDSPLGASGNAGVFGGVTPSLRAKGIPPVTATDGPSGIRLRARSALLPIGTLLASTFDTELVEDVYAAVGREMAERGSDVLLAPGMNLHRNPLCGRNFEYYSEDPLLTGKIAAAAVRGVQREGRAACPKHFACNNQEFNRSHNDSRLSERALREIYLYGFEICVREGNPRYLMTSYNKINGVWAHYHYELVRAILRNEWGFDGCVITDWWMRKGKSPEFKRLKNNAYRVRAGVNVLMPGGGYLGKKRQGGGLLHLIGRGDRLTLGELQRNAVEVLTAVAEKVKYSEGSHE